MNGASIKSKIKEFGKNHTEMVLIAGFIALILFCICFFYFIFTTINRASTKMSVTHPVPGIVCVVVNSGIQGIAISCVHE